MRIDVALGDRSYPIHVVEGGLDGLGEALAKVLSPRPVVVVTNPVVGALYLRACRTSLEQAGFTVQVCEVPDGEAHKTVATWQALVEDLLASGMNRQTPVVALGGGVTGDIAGFAAATVLRGVPVIQVPTTLLAMVDSAVGGKTGVNSPRGKNLVGAFYQPSLVFAAMGTLSTLDPDEYRCGLGEVVKHGVIWDTELFRICAEQAASVASRAPEVLMELVVRSCRAKAAVVAQDEREAGLRSILNFGHTVGHGIEAALGYGSLRHGECVAIGMVAEARWASANQWCDSTVPDAIDAVLASLDLRQQAPPLSLARVLDAMGFDKKVAHGKLRTAILEEIGRVRLDEIPVETLADLLNHLPVET